MLRLIVIAASDRATTQVSAEIYFHSHSINDITVESAVGLSALAERIHSARPITRRHR